MENNNEDEGQEDDEDIADEELLEGDNFLDMMDAVDDDVGQQPLAAESITYDLSLPGTHQYLGSDLSFCSGVTSYELDVSHRPELIIIRIPNVILLPFQKLPLNRVNQACRQALLMSKNRGEHIGIMAEINISFVDGIPNVNFNECVGVTAEIMAIREGTEDVFRAIVEGRQRFKVISHETTGIITRAKVDIIHEASEEIGLFPFETLFPNVYSCQLAGATNNYETSRFSSVDKYSYLASALCSWPVHLLDAYDVRRIRQEIIDKLFSTSDSWRLVEMETDAVRFSYWLIHNLLLPDEWIIHLLRIEHVVSRLRLCMHILEKDLSYRCTRCDYEILLHDHLISLAKEGALQTFVNPHGNHFDMITTRVARNARFQGDYHSEDSWFPGYSWRIMYCEHCFTHLGWMFKATTDKTLVPQYFFGVTRNSVSAKLDPPPQF